MASGSRELRYSIVGDSRDFTRTLEHIDTRLGRSERRFKQFGGVLAGVFSVRAAAGLSKSIIGVATEFDTSMRTVRAVAGATAKEMDAFRKSALDMGVSSGLGARKAATAINELAKGGLTAQQILSGGLKGALGLATAGELELADAAATTANALNLFKLSGSEATHVADAFATAANATTADVSDFALALSQGGAAAKAAGLTFDQATVFLEALAQAGVKGSDAGTSMKAALTHIANPTKKAAEATKELGIEFFNAEGRMKPVQQISKELRDRFEGLTKQQKLQAASTIAGTDGMRALLALADTGPRRLGQLERGLQKQGTAADLARQKNAGFEGAMKRFQASTESLGITIGTAVLPKLTKAADAIAKFVDQMRNGTGAGGRFVDRLKDIADRVRPVAQFFKDHPKLIAVAVGAWATYKSASFLALNAIKVSQFRKVFAKSVPVAAEQGAAAGAAFAGGQAGAGGFAGAAGAGVRKAAGPGGKMRGTFMRAGKGLGVAMGAAVAFEMVRELNSGGLRSDLEKLFKLIMPLQPSGYKPKFKGVFYDGEQPATINPFKTGNLGGFPVKLPNSPVRIVPVPGSPGEEANANVLPKIQAIKKQFGVKLTDAFDRDRSGGHKSPGHNVFGTAGDFSGSDRAMDRAVKALVQAGYKVLYDGRFGSVRAAGHGPSTVAGSNAHFHVELTTSNRRFGGGGGGRSRTVTQGATAGGGGGGGGGGALAWASCTLTYYQPSRGGINTDGDPTTYADGSPVDENHDLVCAAPPEYPFGTSIEFRYKGKKVTCVVRDRGGAIKGQHFDLIVNAARRLGMTGAGRVTAQFRVVGRSAPTKLDRLEARSDLAKLTKTRRDDLRSGRALVNYWQGRLRSARRSGNPNAISTAAQGLAGARADLRDTRNALKQRARAMVPTGAEKFEMAISRADIIEAQDKADPSRLARPSFHNNPRLMRLKAISDRIKAIKRRLKKRISAAERTRLLSELAGLHGQWNEITAPADVGGGTGAAADAPSPLDFLNADLSLAQLNDTDDPASLADNLSVFRRMQSYHQAQLTQAQAGGDPRQIAEAADNLRSVNDSIKSLEAAMNANTDALKEQQADLANELKRQNDLKETVFASQSAQILQGVADMVSGQIGGRVGLGVQTPSFAGSRVRY